MAAKRRGRLSLMGSVMGSTTTVVGTDARPRSVDGPGETRQLDYDVEGIHLRVTSDLDDVLALVDATYAAFRTFGQGDDPADAHDVRQFSLIDLGGTGPCRLDLPDGRSARLESHRAGLFGLLEAMVGTIVAEFHDRGILAAHAGAVAGPSGALVISGRSGQGKTTLVLGLVRAGFGLLSDELALLHPAREIVRPYRRAVHVRPSTLDLLPELAPLRARPLDELGGGSEWTIGQTEVAAMLDGRLAGALPLGAVILLDGRPDPAARPRIVDVPPAIAAIELMRTTWAASVDFAGTLDAVGRTLAGRPCLRLSVGRFEPTVEAVITHLGAAR